LLQRHGSVRTARLRRAEFADDISTFSHIVDQFVAIRSNCSHLYESVLDKEDRSLLVPHVVNDLFLLEGSYLQIRQNRIAKLSTKDRDERGGNGCLGERIIESSEQLQFTLSSG
jgi:hypothetical protein